MVPAVEYNCEGDIIPAVSSAGLHLKVSALYLGFPVTIIDSVVPDSAVQAGAQYTLRWSITPSTLLSGNTVPVSSEVSDAASAGIMMCGRIQARIA